MSFYIIFRKNNFSKNPTIFAPLRPFLGKTECSSNFCSYQFFLILIKYHCAKFRRKSNDLIPSNTIFKRIHIHTYMVQVYHETLQTSNHSGSEINLISVNIQNFGVYNTIWSLLQSFILYWFFICKFQLSLSFSGYSTWGSHTVKG